MRRVLTVLVAGVLVALQFTGAVHAATAPQTAPVPSASPAVLQPVTNSPTPNTPLNITVAPYAQQLVVKQGGVVTATFQIRNNGLQTEHIKGVIKGFSAADDKGIPKLSDAKSSDEFIKWASVPMESFDLEPNVWTSYSVTIKPPKTAAFGYYYAVDFSRANPSKASKGNTVLSSITALILLDVQAPGEVRKAELKEFSLGNKVVEFLPTEFSVRMQNTGNIHVSPVGNVYIYKGKKSVGVLEVNSGTGNVLPNSSRVYTARWTDGTPSYKTFSKKNKDGSKTDSTKLRWDDFKLSKLRFGKYTAELQMVYNNGQYDVPQTAKLSFWVIPWRIIAVVVFIALLVLAGFYMTFIRPIRGRLKRGDARFRR